MIAKITVILLIPVAAAMVYENLAFRNVFAVFGGVPEIPQIREGRIRSQGPFAHPILAGTVGAVCLPLALVLWSRYRREAWIGIVTCLVIVFFSASSGPILSVLAVVVAAGNVALPTLHAGKSGGCSSPRMWRWTWP